MPRFGRRPYAEERDGIWAAIQLASKPEWTVDTEFEGELTWPGWVDPSTPLFLQGKPGAGVMQRVSMTSQDGSLAVTISGWPYGRYELELYAEEELIRRGVLVVS